MADEPTGRPSFGRTARAPTMDLASAMSRRREQVDQEGEHFESKPQAHAADSCGSYSQSLDAIDGANFKHSAAFWQSVERQRLDDAQSEANERRREAEEAQREANEKREEAEEQLAEKERCLAEALAAEARTAAQARAAQAKAEEAAQLAEGRRVKLEETNSQLAAKCRELEAAESAKAEVAQQLSAALQQGQEADAQLLEERRRREKAEAAQAEALAKLKEALQQGKEAAERSESCLARLAEADSQLAEERRRREGAEGSQETLRRQLADAESARQALESSVKQLQEDLRVGSVQQDDLIEEKQREVDELLDEKEDLEKKMKTSYSSLQSLLVEKQRELATAAQAQAAAERKLHEANHSAGAAQEACLRLESSLAEQSRELDAAKFGKDSLTLKLQATEKKVAVLEDKLATAAQETVVQKDDEIATLKCTQDKLEKRVRAQSAQAEALEQALKQLEAKYEAEVSRANSACSSEPEAEQPSACLNADYQKQRPERPSNPKPFGAESACLRGTPRADGGLRTPRVDSGVIRTPRVVKQAEASRDDRYNPLSAEKLAREVVERQAKQEEARGLRLEKELKARIEQLNSKREIELRHRLDAAEVRLQEALARASKAETEVVRAQEKKASSTTSSSWLSWMTNGIVCNGCTSRGEVEVTPRTPRRPTQETTAASKALMAAVPSPNRRRSLA
eukprot:TRINITY_DN10391_c0_g1_i3.p1 TRINITY_DN10391_c0_g1~~TRINITY_DN10391_c0_g1_i3.p1  ORF type:complete len:687 (-),score=258.12 TRINITY_DN10391_c0_g1_i3:115-2175(-)